MNLSLFLIIVLAMMLIGAIPTWSHSQRWGYLPSGGIGLLLLVLLGLMWTGRI